MKNVWAILNLGMVVSAVAMPADAFEKRATVTIMRTSTTTANATPSKYGSHGKSSTYYSSAEAEADLEALLDLILSIKGKRDAAADVTVVEAKEQASAVYRAQLADLSRPSSSSGRSTPFSLRRTPKLEERELRQSRLRPRASSFDFGQQAPPVAGYSQPPDPSSDLPEQPPRSETAPPLERSFTPHHRRATSVFLPERSKPHPALRISKRTHSAILYALEEAVRHPNPFTPDLEEENAQMSDLTGGRASNGARTGGPVPVSSGSGTAGVRTPRDIMRDREERERRRQEEAARAEEQKRLRVQEQRKSAERRAAAMAGTSAVASASSADPRNSARASSQYSTDQSGRPVSRQMSGSERLHSGGRVASGAQYGEPTGRSAQDYTPLSSGRSRGPSVSAQDQPRPAPATSGASRRAQPSASVPRQTVPSEQTPAVDAASPGTGQRDSSAEAQQPQQAAQRSNVSSFPHAFERWEQLSSHWEGLTSYWLRKLDHNQEEIVRNVPTASSMSRQITDLSAAGANLFHAVVELQRLRASSERKFQRWFFETRSESERSQEIRAQMEQQLTLERDARREATEKRVESDIAAENARRELAEMRRELMISKEEARRAWEELGRRNQDSLETAQSLKDGRVTIVSGVQVVPYFGGPSRTGSASQRPTTREGVQSYGPASASGAMGMTPGDDQAYYQDRPSPTDTDPFTESAGHARRQSLHHEPGVQSLAAGTYQPYPLGGTPGSASTGQTVIPPNSPGAHAMAQGQLGVHKPQPPLPVSSEEAQRFYEHEAEEGYGHSQGIGHPIERLTDVASQEEVQPLQFRRTPRAERESSYISEDDYDVEADVLREQELAAQYAGRLGGGDIVPSEAPSAPATSAQAMDTYTPASTGPGDPAEDTPDYEGEGYDRWESVQSTRHHHPTRLSDVLEEEEERSSRRTGD
ncbi:hypothetical protein K431DRAFT_314585 [Polychaeton citri CBS 116435]|uniref:Uncharacterized protein n=1 Tax=Polychaeton citri CBS 116435 TaxID=1314669 RepID=A0A9P4Q1M9_9PEZI|nr:hypothetical protein K431DRAFT_314585 [Polychaeton citri CBS 116435]